MTTNELSTISIALAGLAITTVLFAIILCRAKRVILSEPWSAEDEVQNLEGAQARWWEVAGAFIVFSLVATWSVLVRRIQRCVAHSTCERCTTCGERAQITHDMTWWHCGRCGASWR